MLVFELSDLKSIKDMASGVRDSNVGYLNPLGLQYCECGPKANQHYKRGSQAANFQLPGRFPNQLS